MTDGEILKYFIENQKISKKKIAEDLGMSRQNLYGLFASSTLEDETKEKFEKYFKQDIFSGKYRAAIEVHAQTLQLNQQSKKAVKDLVSTVRQPKTETDPEREGIDFVDISAQAGYPKGILNPMFKSSLKKIFIPGMPYRGENYRIWEVEGNSMEPTFKEGFYVLTEKVEPPWTKIKEHHAHVIVTQDDVYLKRIVHSKTKENHWALVSDNEDLYPPFLLPVEEVKELWFVRRKMDWEMSPPKRFDINI
jgi:phage repressor protein C with HTH and peptisase S24 domain